MPDESRREFLKTLGMTGTVLMTAPLRAGQAALLKEDEPLFRFVQINDTHVEEGHQDYALAREKLRAVVEEINAETHFPRPDFVVGVGDLINGERLEWLAPDLRVFQDLIRPLRCPFYPVMGNHEVVQQEGNPTFEKPYREAFGDHRVNYTFTHQDLLFVALNNSGACSVGESVIRARNDWLRRTLEEAADQPKILLAHIPLVVVREEKVLAESFGFRSYVDHDPETLNVIEQHAESMIAVLCGHLHLTGVAERQGIFHLSVSGLASYPCDYALYTVFRDRIEVAMQSPPPELITPATNIHGRPRYDRGFTDADHPTPEAYVRGTPAERHLVIPLPPQKRPAKGTTP